MQPDTLYVIMYFMFGTYLYFSTSNYGNESFEPLKDNTIINSIFYLIHIQLSILTNSIQYKLTFNMFFTVL